MEAVVEAQVRVTVPPSMSVAPTAVSVGVAGLAVGQYLGIYITYTKYYKVCTSQGPLNQLLNNIKILTFDLDR